MNRKEQTERLQRFCEHIARKTERLEEYSQRYSWARGAVFFSILAFGYFTSGVINDYLYVLGLLVGIVGFLYLADRHQKVHKAIEKLGHLKEIKQQHIARLELDWKEIPKRRYDTDLKDHPFANDLDIVGNYSLHHLVDSSLYDGGSEKLLSWLTNEVPEKEDIIQRQKLIKELIPLQAFRDKLSVIGRYTRSHTSEKDWSEDRMLSWLRQPERTGYKVPLLILGLLSVSTLTTAAFTWMGVVPVIVPLISLLMYLSYYKQKSDKIAGLFEAAYQMEKMLGRFRELLAHVEDFKVSNKKNLRKFLEVYQSAQTKPSVYLKKVKKLIGAASLQANQVLWPLVNLILPWDMYYSMKMEKLKKELEPRLTEWLGTFYELEALNSLANFGALHLKYTFPELTNNHRVMFEAKELGHPLIPANQKVANDFKVEEGKDLFLITGSNMAGKSTFLRTVGINLCLAYAGAPVNAASLKTNLFRVFTSINVKDSLEGGLSHFYAEVRRLRTLLNKLGNEEELPLFYFVDEIFKGTNNRERFQGSTAFLKEIAGKNGVGMVSTHDLELATLEKEIPELSNRHFAETIENGKMSFEYKIKEGPCPTTNALKIMKMEGLPVE
ncbi:MutS family DNA mismatch repair protein [Gracilimonas sp.]|uniref:MutS family DNA mismatch repair protein n=1 Tax=Gracilimonas sp. TaxID=1974203 RepID=UPI003BAA6735